MSLAIEKKRRKTVFDLGHAVHGSEYSTIQRPVNPKTGTSTEPARKFEVTLEPDNFTEEKSVDPELHYVDLTLKKDRYALFENYQKSVHHETDSDVSPSGFKRFLCSGLKRTVEIHNGQEMKIGSYHQCYRLDGRLVAIGVLDLLPHCVSSVYLIYHQDVEDWSFGKLSALREIQLALEGGYQYYYMGFYIHSCIKMRYKGKYKPTYVLDPETYTWDPLDSDLLTRLNLRPYVSMSRERRFNIQPTALPMITDPELSIDEQDDLYEQLSSLNANRDTESSLSLPDYISAQEPSAHIDASSIFEAKTPGAMTLEEVVREIELGGWRLKLQRVGRTVTLQDLVSWEKEELSNPHSIKGIAAELAALFGRKLVEQTVLMF